MATCARRVCLAAAGIAACALAMGGCESGPGQRGSLNGIGYVGHQGESWDVVLPSEPARAAMARGELPGRGAMARRDGDLNVVPQGPRLALHDWPDVERPSISHQGYVRLRTQSDSLIYFGVSRTSTSVHESRYWSNLHDRVYFRD